MNYIKAFNKEVLEIQQANKDRFKNLLDQISNKSTLDFYLIFDNLGSKLGISLIAKPVIDRNDNIIGYIPILRYKEDNLISETAGDYKLYDNYVSITECYRCLANKFVYKLMEIRNIPL